MKLSFLLLLSMLTGVSVTMSRGAEPKASPTPASLEYHKQKSGYLLILRPGQKVMESLAAFETKENIKGANFNGIGAVKNVTVGYYNFDKKDYDFKTYESPGEVVSFSGSLARLENKPAIHAHMAVAGPDNKVYGGHLKEAEVTITLEIFVQPTDKPIERHEDPAFTNVKTIKPQ